ncbi:hypothetical protein [Nocardioides solisilvae]|uniref:hypothetical protein n=1 Tax=Nocardioides solisilvae TaxID=1542435 RepID=UPI000D741476|nr:hypothetical protein [Nocardioides solisilvae]
MTLHRAAPAERARGGQLAGVGTAVLVRVATLAQLLVAALVLDAAGYAVVAVALGVAAAAQVVTDSGAAAYLAILERPGPRVLRQLVAWQALVGGVAAGVGALLVLRAAAAGDATVLVVALAVPATSAVESVGRLCRVQWLRGERVHAYASVDGGYAAARLVPVGCLLAGWGAWSFVPGLVLALAATLVVWAGARVEAQADAVAAASVAADRAAGDEPVPFARTVRRSMAYGVPVMATGLYSQAPVVVTAALSSVETAAAVAVAARLVQPLEMVAASYSQMALPALARGRMVREHLLAVLGAQGLALGVGGAVGVAGFLWVTGADRDGWVLAFLMLAVLPVKYLNYGQAALLTAARRPDLRTVVSVGLGLVCLTAVVLVARGPAWEVGAVVVVNELLLLVGLGVAVRAAQGPAPRRAAVQRVRVGGDRRG